MKSYLRGFMLSILGGALVMALSWTAPARAEFVGSLVQINVSAGGHTGSWTLGITADSDPFDWKLSAPFNIYSSTNSTRLLATIDDLSFTYNGDPEVLLNFAVTSGASATLFSINSTVVAFAPILNPDSFATAAVTVTDNNSNGATLTGQFPGSKAYQAAYNGGTPFANLISPVTAIADFSNIGIERNPLSGSVPIAGSVFSISSSFNFLLTARDSASGTSRFNVVPEPSAIVLAGVGALALLFARRRRS